MSTCLNHKMTESSTQIETLEQFIERFNRDYEESTVETFSYYTCDYLTEEEISEWTEKINSNKLYLKLFMFEKSIDFYKKDIYLEEKELHDNEYFEQIKDKEEIIKIKEHLQNMLQTDRDILHYCYIEYFKLANEQKMKKNLKVLEFKKYFFI